MIDHSQWSVFTCSETEIHFVLKVPLDARFLPVGGTRVKVSIHVIETMNVSASLSA